MASRRSALLGAISMGLVATAALAQPAGPDQRPGMRGEMRRRERIYGSEMMSDSERQQYRERMRKARTREERQTLRTEHHEQMKARAKERGMTLPDAPPGDRPRGRMGRGGMGSSGPGRGS